MLDALPKLRFVLIGDSGERDPEAYRAVAEAHPDWIVGIVIRPTPGANNDASRFAGMRVIADDASSPDALKDLVVRGLGP